MEKDVMKVAVINRTRHKRSYHGFGVLELKDLLQLESSRLTTKTTTEGDTSSSSPERPVTTNATVATTSSVSATSSKATDERTRQWTQVVVTILPSVSEKLVPLHFSSNYMIY